MRATAFPRRPSHFIRYIFPAILLICFLYYLSSDSDITPLSERPVFENSYPPSDAAIKRPPPPPPKLSTDEINVPGIAGIKQEKEHASSSSSVEKPIEGGNSKTNGDDADEDHDGNDSRPAKSWDKSKSKPVGHHPIDVLIQKAHETHNELLSRESHTLKEAAKAYRDRRGRHPPPGFDEWYQFAKDNDAIVVEDFFDRIYHDLNPFWGLDPKMIRREAREFEMTINIRNHNATAQSDWFWTQIWLKMIKTIENMLPDMDIALNAMDEPRIVTPWEDIAKYMHEADRTRKLAPVDKVISAFEEFPAPEKDDKNPLTMEKHWEREDISPFWVIARRGCPPDSPARRLATIDSNDGGPRFSPEWALPHQFQGYVANYTLSTEFCHQPDLQALEGIFIHPLSTASTKVLFPLFGGSKLATNNEILLPPPMYWNEEERFTGGDNHGPPWDEKLSPLVWRGVATGGRNKESNWKGFQRHRFVAMNNGTKISRAESEIENPVNFELPSSTYHVTASEERRLGEWVSQWADVGFTDLFCDDKVEPKPEGGTCPYTDKHFKVIPGMGLAEQFMFKYLPDIDGNSFSGRYLGFLRSTGMPIKSTMWHEWHDSRLVAWKHFVPMDNRFDDYYGIMEYFLGYEKIRPGHDEEAKTIAMDGKEWAEKVLRKEDMQVYVLRLLLEYARVSDPRREGMGWVEDLL